MCSHRYQNDTARRCFAALLYEWWGANASDLSRSEVRFTDLPLDETGLCVFHSSDAEFKGRSDLAKRFRDLVEMSFLAQPQRFDGGETIDCEGFVFTGTKSEYEVLGEQRIIDFSELEFGQPCSFKGVQFLDVTWFNHAVFLKWVDFTGCSFADTVHFESTAFNARAVFLRCVFAGDAGFMRAKFQRSSQFVGCIFSGSAAFNETLFACHASFNGSSFEEAYFHHVKFLNGINEGITGFEKTEFKRLAQFRDCQFSGEASFAGCQFATGEFLDVTFSPNRVTHFDGIQVRSALTFKNLDPQDKVFNHTVAFDVSAADIAGRIFFENANIYHIAQVDRIRQLAAPGVAKITIGPGCDKYRLRVEFELPLDVKWKSLVEEMVETFVIFFEWSGKIPIQVNVECEYVGEKLLVRYFADSDITHRQFAGLLADRVPAFLELLNDPAKFMQKHDHSKNAPEDMVLAYDAMRKAASLQMALLPRIKNKLLGEDDFLNILASLGKSRIIKKLCINLVQNFNQRDVLSFGTTKYIVGGNITEVSPKKHESDGND